MSLTSQSTFLFCTVLKKVVPGCQHEGVSREKTWESLEETDSSTQNMKLLWRREGEINLNKMSAVSLHYLCQHFSPHSWVKHTFSSPCSTVGEMEAQRGKVTCPRSHPGEEANQELNISLLNRKVSVLAPLYFLPYGVCLLNGETSTACQRSQIIYSSVLIWQEMHARRPGEQLALSKVTWLLETERAWECQVLPVNRERQHPGTSCRTAL